MKHLTLNEVKERFVLGNATLLETIYKNNNTKMHYLCHQCNQKSWSSLHNFQKGQRPCHATIERIKKTSHTLEKAKEIFHQGNATLLAEKYVNCKTKMAYKCHKCNKIANMDLSEFQSGGRSCCGQNNRGATKRFSLEQVQQIFQNNDATLLETTYANCKTKMQYLCHHCNKKGFVNLNNFQVGKRGCCNGTGRAFSLDNVKNIFKEGNAELLTTEYKNNLQKLLYYCKKCGNEGKIRLDHFKQGVRSCCGSLHRGDKTRFTLDQVRVVFKKGNATLLEIKYKNSITKMLYKCHVCNKLGEINLTSFQSGQRPCHGQIKAQNNRRKHYQKQRMLKLILGAACVIECTGKQKRTKSKVR